MNELKIRATITEKFDAVTGTNSNGDWKKTEFLCVTDGDYPKTISFVVWKEKVADFIRKGNVYDVYINIESKEHNGNYYTNVTAYKVDVVKNESVSKPEQPKPEQPKPSSEKVAPPQSNLEDVTGDDDLPF